MSNLCSQQLYNLEVEKIIKKIQRIQRMTFNKFTWYVEISSIYVIKSTDIFNFATHIF